MAINPNHVAQTTLRRGVRTSPLLSRRVVDLILFKTYAELKSEAQRTYIGILWWLIEPIIFMAIFYFVFGILFQRGTEGYIPFLLVGLTLWHWIQATIMQASNAILVNYPLINQVFVPKVVFPTVILLANSVKFLVVFAILLLYLGLSGDGPSWIWLEAIIILPAILILITGCAFVAAAITPLLPDIRVVIENFLRVLFYLSGIFFQIEALPDPIRQWMRFNPFAMAIHDLRLILIDHVSPPFWNPLLLAVVGGALAVVGLMIMRRNETRYAKLPM
jgi:lipopolysaccharide transport system permease protein